jgi:dienelactone hydrolase
LKPERVTFETDDKLPITIVGTYTPPRPDEKSRRAPAVILLHMYGEERTTFDPLVPSLHEAGFAVLAIDLRGHGESVEPASLKLKDKAEERDPRLFRDMVKDVEAAHRWLTRRSEVDPARVVIVGASVGASIALDYAARDKSVDGLVLLTPGLDYLDLDSKVSARKVRNRPLLMLAAEEERRDADDLAREIPGAKVTAVGPRPPGAHSMALHGTRMLGKAQGVEKMIVDFLVEAAGPPSDKTVVASMIGEVYYDPGTSQADRLSPDNLRTFSSAAEAEARGYRPPKRSSRKK